jgi:hypothetical protein
MGKLNMKFFKITYKTKTQMETKYLDSKDLKSFKYNHKSKYIEFEIHGNIESGFLKILNISALEIFLTSLQSGIFTLELFEDEEETC